MTGSPLRRRVVIGLALMASFNLGVFARPFIDAARQPEALDLLESSVRISQPGIAGAPKVWVAFDPYCRYCHKLYGALTKRVEAGEVQVEWVPVAFMDADSSSVAAELLSAADPSIALSRWFGAEAGTSPVLPKGANPNGTAAKIASNTEVMRLLIGRNAAPAVFYRDRNGNTQLTVGMPADFDEWFKDVAS